MQVETTPIEGLLVVSPRLFRDERGFFMESWSESLWASQGIGPRFVQDNHSLSSRGTLRGLHFQSAPGQGKLVRCTRGEIWDVAVDIRPGSTTYGHWHGVLLDDRDHRQFWIPVGFAHGFIVLSEVAEVQYKCTAPYNAATEAGIAWDDPDVAVDWKLDRVGGIPLLSARDRSNPTLSEWINCT